MKSHHHFLTHVTLVALFVLSLTWVGATPVSAKLINFDALDVSSGGALGVEGAPLDTYLASFGVTMVNVTATTTVGVKTPPTFDTNVVLVTNANYMSQWWNSVNGTSYDLMFSQPLTRLDVSIPQITGGVLVPGWVISSLDVGGNPLTSFGTGNLESSPQARRTFNFSDAGLQGLRVYSDVAGLAGMRGIPIDDINFEVANPEPSTYAMGLLAALGLYCWRRKRL